MWAESCYWHQARAPTTLYEDRGHTHDDDDDDDDGDHEDDNYNHGVDVTNTMIELKSLSMMANHTRPWLNMIIFVVSINVVAIIGFFDIIIISFTVLIIPFIVLIILAIMIFIMMMIIHRTERGEQVVINAMHFTETTTGSDSRTWYLHSTVQHVYFTETSNALEAIAT